MRLRGAPFGPRWDRITATKYRDLAREASPQALSFCLEEKTDGPPPPRRPTLSPCPQLDPAGGDLGHSGRPAESSEDVSWTPSVSVVKELQPPDGGRRVRRDRCLVNRGKEPSSPPLEERLPRPSGRRIRHHALFRPFFPLDFRLPELQRCGLGRGRHRPL